VVLAVQTPSVHVRPPVHDPHTARPHESFPHTAPLQVQPLLLLMQDPKPLHVCGDVHVPHDAP